MLRSFDNILLIKMSSMGDILHALPAACALRDHFPKSRISWLIDKRFVHLIEGHPALDEIICADAPAWVDHIPYRSDIARGLSHFRILRELRDRKFDCVFDLQNLFRSGIIAWSTGSRTRVGLNDWREFAPLFYTHRARLSHPHVVRHYLSVVERIIGPVTDVRFDLPVREDARNEVSTLLRRMGMNEGTPFVVVAPKSSQSFKDWPADRFAVVVRHLNERWSLPTVLVGAIKDKEICEEVGHKAGTSPHLFLGHTLDELIALLERPRLVIGLDSGPTHVASTLGKRVLGIYGPTDPVRSAPWGSEDLAVHCRPQCSACQLPFNAPWGIPGIRHTCLMELMPEQVIATIDREMQSHRAVA